MGVKVISRDLIEINPGEVVQQVIISEKILFWGIKTVYRKVHGQYFVYKNGRYTRLNWRHHSDLEAYFNLPIE